jgi:GNAT superfamily N-acetyltransferase
MSYRFTRYQPKYREEVVRLQTVLWGPDLALNTAYLTWKYEQNPYLDEPLIYLALHNERVVGMRGLFGAQWEIGRSGQTVILPCAGDTTIAPDHRNRGLLRQLLQFIQSDKALSAFPYMLSLSAGAPVYFCSLSEGWRLIGAYGAVARTSLIGKLLRSERLRSMARPWQDHPAVKKVLSVAAHLRRPSAPRAHIQSSSHPRAEDMARLVERTDRADKIRQRKDSRFYGWRFGSPLSRYRFYYRQANGLEGFLVLNTRLAVGPVHLVDWAASTPEVLTDLLKAAVQDFASLEIWSATLPETMVATLGELGFTPAESILPDTAYRPSLLAQRLSAASLDGKWSLAGRDVSDLKNWELRMVCSDQY